MDVSEFISPLETVQVISIFSYINTLSDFLYTQDFLDKNDQHKHIPIVNALYKYLNHKTTENIQVKKYNLVRKLINGTDLYGAKENESPDPYFVDTLFEHLINSLVFNRFINVFGFITLIAYATERESLIPLQHQLKKALISLTFENEYGDDSQLSPLAIDNIFSDYIKPLFPEPQNYSIKVTSIDYIYAMAGNMFLKSKTASPVDGIFKKTNGSKYQEYIEIAHAVEQLVLAKKINETALRIFAFPAIIHYVLKEKGKLNQTSINEIIRSHDHWKEAYKSLFSYINDAFTSMENIQKNNYRYQFYLALSNYKNRTTMAREAIEMNCLSLTESEMEDEIIKYKNNPNDYRCRFVNENLGDLNKNYQKMVEEVSDKYYTFEKESCRAVFGEEFITEMDHTSVVVSKGLIRYFYYGGLGSVEPPVQMVNESHDLLQFYFPNTEKYVYYALVRQGYNVTLIKETDNPNLFRKTIGLDIYQTFRSNYFPDVLKSGHEKFDTLLNNIATKRKEKFQKLLEKGYDQTWREWWKDFGLSLIPFYSCIKDIEEKSEEAEIICPLDALFLVPVLGEVGIIARESFAVASKSALALTETTLRTVTLRTSFQTILRITSKALIDEITQFGALFSRETFTNLGISLLRYIDPGFELVFSLGQNGLRGIRYLIIQAERAFPSASTFFKRKLLKAQYALSHFSRKVEPNFGRVTYVNSILGVDSGYGFKYLPLKNGKYAEVRTVHPSLKEIPLVKRNSVINTEEIEVQQYSQVDVNSEELIGDGFFDDMEGIIVSEERTYEFNFVSREEHLLKNPLDHQIISSKERLSEAVEFVIKDGRLSEDVVREELKKYAFPIEGKTELDFVKDWTENNLQLPKWAKNYKIDEPEIFYNLRNSEVFDVKEISASGAQERIEALYPPDYDAFSLMGWRAASMAEDYMTKSIYKYLNFEDYFAVRNYCGSGYRRIGDNTVEARRMKNGIYRLAVRQSEDPIQEYEKVLFRGEHRLSESVEKLFVIGNEFVFERFTSTTANLGTAICFSGWAAPSKRSILYEMQFSEPYMRAKVSHLTRLDEEETILLPGTKFRVSEVVHESDTQKFIKVKLIQVEKDHAEWQRDVMEQIKHLKETNTVFYVKDLSDYHSKL